MKTLRRSWWRRQKLGLLETLLIAKFNKGHKSIIFAHVIELILVLILLVLQFLCLLTTFYHRLTKNNLKKLFPKHGKREGATLLTGGKRVGNKGYYIEPTIFTNVKVNTNNSFEMHMKCLYFYVTEK